MEDDLEKQNRILLRPWLENMLTSGKILGLVWHDPERTMFRVPWKHRSKKDWSVEHCSVFVEWAKNTGRWRGDNYQAPNFAQLKTRLRCAFNKAPDIEEMKELHCNHGEEPYKVYRFKMRKDVSLRKIRNKVLPNSSNPFSKLSMEIENVKKFDNSPAASAFTENSNEELTSERTIVSNNSEEKNVSSSGKDMGKPILNSFLIKKQFNSDFQTVETSTNLELNKPSTNQPFIPLSVELLAASSDSGSERGSPSDLNTFDIPDASCPVSRKKQTKSRQCYKDVDTPLHGKQNQALPNQLTSVATKEDSYRISSNQEESPQLLTSKEHMLQVASLFVEAGEKITQQDSSLSAPMVPLHSAYNSGALEYQSSVMTALKKDEELSIASCFNRPQLFGKSTQNINCEDISSDGLLHPEVDPMDLTYKSSEHICQEPIDLTKKAVATQFRPKCEQSQKVNMNSCEHNTEENSKTRGFNALLNDMDFEGLNFLLTDTIEDIRMKAKRGEQMLVSKAKLLCQWEEHLKRWEASLLATETACYWKNKFLDMELANKCPPINKNLQELNDKFGINHQSSSFLVDESRKSIHPRLMLPIKGYKQLNVELPSFPDEQIIQDTVHSLSKNNIDGMSAKQFHSRPLSKVDSSLLVSPKSLSLNKKKRVSGSVTVDKFCSGAKRKGGSLQQKDFRAVGSVNTFELPQFAFQNHTADATCATLQPSLVLIPSVARETDVNNRNLVCSQKRIIYENVSDEDSVVKSNTHSEPDILPVDSSRIILPTTEAHNLTPTTLNSSTLLSLTHHTSSATFSNSSVVESSNLPSSEQSQEPEEVRKMKYAVLPPVTGVSTEQDSDCESGLVIEMSDEEEKLLEEEDKNVRVSPKCYMINQCSDQEQSENAEQKLHSGNKQTTETENLLVKNLTFSVINNSRSPETVLPNSHCSSVGLNAKVSEVSFTSGSQSHGGHSLQEFTEWLRKKTQILCQKELYSSTDDGLPMMSEEADKHCAGNNSTRLATRKRRLSATNNG